MLTLAQSRKHLREAITANRVLRKAEKKVAMAQQAYGKALTEMIQAQRKYRNVIA